MCSIFDEKSTVIVSPEKESREKKCYLCEDEICVGEEYYGIGDKDYHRNCLLEGYTKRELLDLVGVTPRVIRNVIRLTVTGKVL